MTASVMAQIGTALRSLMNSNGFSSVKLIGLPGCFHLLLLPFIINSFRAGYEHNWDDAAAYPVTLMEDAPNAFNGVAFHCYAVRCFISRPLPYINYDVGRRI